MEQQGLYKRNVLFFKPEDVTRRNGEVFTPNNMGMSKLRKSEQFKKEVVFNGGMSESDVRIRLEEVFPVLINKRFSCAARSAQDSARLEFHGVRRIWNGRTIRTKLRGQSALYVVLEEESLVNQSSYLAEEGTLSTTAAMQVYSGVSSSASNHSHLSSMDISTSTFEDIPHDLKDVLTGHFYVNEGLLEKMECTPEADENFQGMFEPFNAMSSVQMYGQSESAQRDLPLVALRNNAFDDDNDGGNRRIPSELWRGQMPVTVSTDISGKPTESGYSSEECLTQRSTAIGSSVDINPTKGPLQGGIPFRLHFEKKLSESLNFGWALFADSQPVKAWKTCQDDVLYGDNIPPGTQAGNVVVTVLTQSNRYLGRTLFTYVDEEEQWLEQMVRNKKLQGKFFKKLCRKYESDESDESDEIGKQNSESSGSSNHGRQQNSLDVLRRLVYTAARIGAGEFIRMLFSTSARRIVFKAYKNRCPLPEDIADANGHYEIATYLRSATERFSSENEATQTSKDIDWLELARAAENSDAEAGSIKRPCKEQREGDNSGEEYFGDAETSSSDSEKEVYFSKENLKRDFDKDLESEGCVSKGNSVLVSEEAEKQPKCEVLVEERKCDGDGDSSCGSLRKVRSTSLDEGIDTFHKDIANLACFQDSEGISCDSNDCINCSTKHVHQTYVDQGNSDNSEGMKELNENERSAGDGNESSCASRLEPLGTGSEKKCNEDFFERMQSGLKEFAKNLFRRRNVVSRDIFQRLKDPPEPNESLEVRQNYSQSLEDQSAEFDSVKTNLAKEKCYKDENQDLAFYPQKQKTDVEEATKSLTDQLGIALANERRAKEELEKLKEEIKAERESEQAARVTEKQKRGVQISQLMDTFKHSLQAMNKKIDSLVTNIGQLPKIQVEIGGKAIEIDAHDGISDQTVQLKMALDDSRRQLETIHRNALEMYKEEVEDLKAECSRAEFLAKARTQEAKSLKTQLAHQQKRYQDGIKAQDDYISQLHMKFNDVRRCAETTEEKYFFSLVIAAKLNMAVCGYRVDHLNHLEPQKLFETVREHGISIEYWPSWISRELSMAIEMIVKMTTAGTAQTT